jgi:hypothetical protein
MVYNTQNYWVFGLCPRSGILENIKHEVSETGSVSVFRCESKTPHLRTEKDAVSETSCFLFSTIPDDGKSLEIQ